MRGTSYSRLLRPTGGASFFLLGVRGVGKSTWARREFSDALWVDLLDEARFHELTANPGALAAELRAVPASTTVVIDEVQRVPALLNEVHRAIEEQGRRFVLLGSSARRLTAAGTNLLAGRAVRRLMFPLTPAELGTDFDLDRVLEHGSIPLVWQSEDPRATLQAYVELYLREEIRAEAMVRNLPAFLRFLPVAALFHGQAVNVSAIARDAGAARTTVEGYIQILIDTLLVSLLPGFEPRLRVRERKHPKLYWVDPGVVRAARRQLGPVQAGERGSLLEGLVHTMLRAHNEVGELFEDISYWRAPSGAGTEVDFVMRRGNDFLAVEVKASPRFNSGATRGLRAIGDLPGLVRRVLVYPGERILRTEDGIDVLPLDSFSAALAAGTFWP